MFVSRVVIAVRREREREKGRETGAFRTAPGVCAVRRLIEKEPDRQTAAAAVVNLAL